VLNRAAAGYQCKCQSGEGYVPEKFHYFRSLYYRVFILGFYIGVVIEAI
jgi:hypothetical protein|tara:strand:- start:610 stop:756 length:147 start_codon:yes stop_codon:yes gene_type:complete